MNLHEIFTKERVKMILFWRWSGFTFTVI